MRYFKLFLLVSSISLFQNASASVSESCDCTIDTAGYASFVTTLNIADVPIQFHVHNNFAVAIGYITTTTPTAVNNLIANHPNVKTIVMLNSGGSEDDYANLQASAALHNAGMNMYLPSNGEIASGAVDMFLAGTKRVVDQGAYVGVHSWSDGQNDATAYPVGHQYHLEYINYYTSVGFSQQDAEDFYYFTINAAPAAGIHWMTEAEIDQYKIRTCKYSGMPNYSISTSPTSLTADLSGATYQWINCSDNSAISGETNQSYSPSENGTYAVIVTETSCSDTSECIAFTLGQNSINEAVLDGVSLFPNPNTGNFQISLSESMNVKVTVFDVNGKMHYSTDSENEKMIQINQDLPSGIYFVSLESNSKTGFLKMIVR